MAHAGQTLDNPVSGERIEFLRTAADTDGALLAFELTLDPHGRVPATHVHPEQEERFHVLEGAMKFRVGLRTVIAGAGDTVVAPVGRAHKFTHGEGVTPRFPGRRHKQLQVDPRRLRGAVQGRRCGLRMAL